MLRLMYDKYYSYEASSVTMGQLESIGGQNQQQQPTQETCEAKLLFPWNTWMKVQAGKTYHQIKTVSFLPI